MTNSIAVKRVMIGITLGTCDAVRKVIKEYTMGYSFVLSNVTGMLECYKDNELVAVRPVGMSYESFVKTDAVLGVFGIDGVELQKIVFVSV